MVTLDRAMLQVIKQVPVSIGSGKKVMKWKMLLSLTR